MKVWKWYFRHHFDEVFGDYLQINFSILFMSNNLFDGMQCFQSVVSLEKISEINAEFISKMALPNYYTFSDLAEMCNLWMGYGTYQIRTLDLSAKYLFYFCHMISGL